MKKILSILILVACLSTLFSCAFGGGNKTADITAFQNAVMNTDVKNIVITAVTENDLGTLTSTYEVSYKDDNTSVIKYSYQKFNAIGEGAEDEIISTYTGTVTRKADGTYEGDLPEGVNLSSATVGMVLDFTAVKDTAVVSEDGNVMTVTVPAASTSAVFGYSFSKDVEFEMTLSNGTIASMVLTFEGGSIDYKYN